MQAERNVLSAVLSAPECYWRVADRLHADDFSGEGFRSLWSAITARMQQGKPADVVSVADAHPALADLAYGLLDGFVSAAHLEGHADLIRQSADVRRVRNAGQRIVQLTGEDAFAEAQRLLLEAAPKTRDAVKSTRDGLREMVALLKKRMTAGEQPEGLSWGIPSLDAAYRPEAEHLCVIAARPKTGKTALAMQCALTAAQSGRRVFVASLEMSLRELTERATAHLGDFPLSWIKSPADAPDHAMARVVVGSEALEPLPLLIDDTPGLTVTDVIARATQLHMAEPLGCVLVDHLGLLSFPGDNLVREIGNATKALKGMAKRLKVPVLLVCQLNRSVETRADREPRVSDLRDSGRIEEDMDCAVLMHRDRDNRGLVKVLVRANRHGEEADVYLREHLARMRLEGGDADEWTTGRPETAGNGRTFAERFGGPGKPAPVPGGRRGHG